jgi:hypothetical protein
MPGSFFNSSINRTMGSANLDMSMKVSLEKTG